MKVSQKIVLVSAVIILFVISILSWTQYVTVRDSLYQKAEKNINETSSALGFQVSNWLNGKLHLIDMMAQSIDADFNQQRIQQTFNLPILKNEFLLIFGGLDTDGKAITNDRSWNPANWDARQRPWYGVAKAANGKAALTDPYADASTGEILISVVANFSDNGTFKGAFGGDLSLKTVSDAVNTINFGGAGYTFLLNANGTIISHPNNKLNGQKIAKLFTQDKPKLTTTLQTLDMDDQTALVSFHPLKNLQGTNWMIGVVVDKDIIMSDAYTIGTRALIAAILGVLISSVILFPVMTHVLKPLKQLHESLIEINRGEGDLTERLPITSNDEFGKVSEQFNIFISYLQEMIIEIKQLSSGVRDGSSLTNHAAQNASNNLQQLEELDQLATAMSEMSSTAHEVADNAQRGADSASSAQDAASHGSEVVAKTTGAINQLSSDMEEAVSTINNLAEYSSNIESILSVITGIAEQTNLLALNAAIEAARAGEQGRGFAVVADEVRALASRTQQSTEEIQNMINQLISGVKQAEQKINHSKTMANDTRDISSQANEALQAIRDRISEISDMNIQIAAAAEEQSATTEEINRNTTNIRDISQIVADGAKEQTMHCQNMEEQADQQQNRLNVFKV
ncbi:methyl-accepting chemotaxis protein [Litoribacillus peritrichatus]|uniref:Methyl-accepting chemotaxis protein Mlp37 n=1 Tax=Litoribacillus peritrichatus TaxID=718191 RepID=A0ABP7M1M4_9GAMM